MNNHIICQLPYARNRSLDLDLFCEGVKCQTTPTSHVHKINSRPEINYLCNVRIHIQPKISKRILRQAKFSISRISFVCTRLTSFKLSYFFGDNSVSLKKDRMLSILRFSNRSVRLFTLRNRYRITAKVLHSIIQIDMVKLATVLEGDPKVPLSIATTPRCRGGHYSIPQIVPLYP